MKVIIFCGFHNTGKTTLLKKCIAGLLKKGYTVSTLKHIQKDSYILKEKTDTLLFLLAGSETVVGVSKNYTVQYSRKSKNNGENMAERLSEILKSLKSDFILIEGFKSYRGGIQKIVFGKDEEEIKSLIDTNTIGYCGIGLKDLKIPDIAFLPIDMNSEKIARFVEKNATDY